MVVAVKTVVVLVAVEAAAAAVEVAGDVSLSTPTPY
jgi:hypothetical protein